MSSIGDGPLGLTGPILPPRSLRAAENRTTVSAKTAEHLFGDGMKDPSNEQAYDLLIVCRHIVIVLPSSSANTDICVAGHETDTAPLLLGCERAKFFLEMPHDEIFVALRVLKARGSNRAIVGVDETRVKGEY